MAGEPQDLDGTVETEHAVHLVFRVDHDWDSERELAVAEAERKVASLTDYARSPAFAARYGERLGVLRCRTARQPPSIVTELLAERGVEVDAEDRAPAEPGVVCTACGRAGLAPDQAAMTDEGWACPSCFRAWTRLREARASQPAGWVRVGIYAALALAALTGAIYWLIHATSKAAVPGALVN